MIRVAIIKIILTALHSYKNITALLSLKLIWIFANSLWYLLNRSPNVLWTEEHITPAFGLDNNQCLLKSRCKQFSKMLFLIYLVIAICALVAYLVHRNTTYWRDRGIPQDPAHPFYGNTVGFRKNRDLHGIVTEYYNKFRKSGHPFVGFNFLHRRSAFVMDVLAKCKHVLAWPSL